MLLLFSCSAADEEPPELDVSGLFCAGADRGARHPAVPLVSTDGCTGASMTGAFLLEGCDGCSFPDDGQVHLRVLFDDGDYAPCPPVALSAAGTFDAGRVVPERFSVMVVEQVVDAAGRTVGPWASDEVQVDVCSEDVHVEATIPFENWNDTGTGW